MVNDEARKIGMAVYVTLAGLVVAWVLAKYDVDGKQHETPQCKEYMIFNIRQAVGLHLVFNILLLFVNNFMDSGNKFSIFLSALVTTVYIIFMWRGFWWASKRTMHYQKFFGRFFDENLEFIKL